MPRLIKTESAPMERRGGKERWGRGGYDLACSLKNAVMAVFSVSPWTTESTISTSIWWEFWSPLCSALRTSTPQLSRRVCSRRVTDGSAPRERDRPMRSLRDRREDTDRQTRIEAPQDLTSEAGITEPKRVTVSFDLIAMDVHDLVPSQKLRIHRLLRQRLQRWG